MIPRIKPLALILGLTASYAPLNAAPLAVVAVVAPGINCIFDPSCKVTVGDAIGAIPVPGITGAARLQSRTFQGTAGAPAAGMTGYLYRVDLTQAAGEGDTRCVGALVLDFGSPPRFDYDNNSSPDDVFVITSGGLGAIPLAWAVRTGYMITFAFAKPVCAGSERRRRRNEFLLRSRLGQGTPGGRRLGHTHQWSACRGAGACADAMIARFADPHAVEDVPGTP